MRTARTLIRLGRSESSLGAHAILFVLSCCGSYVMYNWPDCYHTQDQYKKKQQKKNTTVSVSAAADMLSGSFQCY